MQWKLDLNEKHKETQVIIQTDKVTDNIAKLTTFIDQISYTIAVKKADQQMNIDIVSIIYIENIERMTFIYTELEMFEVERPLYELEDELEAFEFVRINKQTLINPRYIKSVKALLNSRFELLMTSSEKLIVTRRYRKSFKAFFNEGGVYDA